MYKEPDPGRFILRIDAKQNIFNEEFNEIDVSNQLLNFHLVFIVVISEKSIHKKQVMSFGINLFFCSRVLNFGSLLPKIHTTCIASRS